MSRTNFLRLWHPDAVPEKEEWFSLLKQASEDVEFNRAFTNVGLSSRLTDELKLTRGVSHIGHSSDSP